MRGFFAPLGVDTLDLFYLHRIDQNIPIEISMLEMKKLVEEGKVKIRGAIGVLRLDNSPCA